MEPSYRKHRTGLLTNWQPVHDDYEGGWLIEHYVGGEDGYIAMGDYANEAEAEAAALEANAAGHTHTHIIDL